MFMKLEDVYKALLQTVMLSWKILFKSVLTRKAADWDRKSGTEGSAKPCSFFVFLQLLRFGEGESINRWVQHKDCSDIRLFFLNENKDQGGHRSRPVLYARLRRVKPSVSQLGTRNERS